MTDLDRLIAAVEAGVCPDFCPMWHGIGLCTAAERAFGGELDAALRLHDTLLPGRDYCIDFVQRVDPLVYVQDDGGPTFDAEAKTPARAWLLAILRALKAREAA